jgi:hypothetical protein
MDSITNEGKQSSSGASADNMANPQKAFKHVQFAQSQLLRLLASRRHVRLYDDPPLTSSIALPSSRKYAG